MNLTPHITRDLQYERKTRLAKRVLIALPIVYVGFAILYLLDGLVYSALSNFIYSSIALICVAFLSQRTYRAIVIIVLSLISLEALFQSWILGSGMGIPYVFLVIYPFIFLLSSFSDKRDMAILLGIHTLAFIVSAFPPDMLANLQEVPPEMMTEHKRYTIIFATIMLVGAFYMLSRDNWKFEVALIDNQIKLDAIYNSTSDANFLIAQDGTILSFNETAKAFFHQLLGREVQEGDRVMDKVPNAIRQLFHLNFPDIENIQGKPIRGEIELTSGETRMIEQRAYTVKNHQGDPWAISFNLRDITSEHKLQLAMEARDALLNSINQNIKDGIYRMRSEKDLIYANNAFLQMFGYDTPEHAAEAGPGSFYKKQEDRALFLDKLKSDAQVASMEIEFKRSNGSTFWGAISAIRTQDSEGRTIFDGSIRDISEIKLARDELIKAKEAAEAASRAKAEFLSTMSHEIRTPMNAVLGMTDLLMMEEPRDDQIDQLETLKFSANHLLKIIDDILDLSKIDSGNVELEFSEVSIRQLMKSIITGFEPKAKEKGLDLRFELDASIPAIIVTDATRVNQVLTNLLSNATKFTEEGHVTIQVELENLTNGRARIKFSVEDTGIGIAPENKEKVFEQFQQEHSYTTRKFGGTGLGLTIVKRLLNLLGSEIHLDSTPGVGSTFWFVLEVDAPKKAIQDLQELDRPQTVANYQYQQFDNLNVLVVEDNVINIKIATKFLEKWGIDADVAEDGEIAVQKASVKKYDIILMDLQMPNMDGFQAATEIRKFDKDVLIIALTASAMLEVQNEVYNHGMDDFITKPIVPQEFNRKLSEYAVSIKN